MRDSETGEDKAVFTVAMSSLIQIHEIHIDFIIRKLLVSLGMKVKQGLVEDLQTLDPHFCRREGVHPGHNTNAVIIAHDALHVFHADL